MKTAARFFLLLLLAVVLYLLFYPVPIDPVAWDPPEAPSLEGPYQANHQLAAMEVLFRDQCPQCEDVAIDSTGRIYGGAGDGRILRMTPGSSRVEELAQTGGRPLGLDFDQSGRLLIADAQKGLLRLEEDGQLRVLSQSQGGRPFKFVDDLEVGPDGVIYFSDASDTYGIENYKLDILERRPHGRLLAYHTREDRTELLLDSLYFANGVAVDSAGRFVLVNETNAYRVRRYWLKGPRAGQSDMFIENLPGYPDGISRGSGGVFWVPLISLRKRLVDGLMPHPFLRKVLARLPVWMQPSPDRYGFVLGLNEKGSILYNLQDPTGKFYGISSVQEAGGTLYMGSLEAGGVGKIAIPD